MKKRTLAFFALGFGVVLFSFGSASAQVVDAVKDAADKTKDVTVKVAKKSRVVVTDGFTTAAEKTKDVSGDVANKTKSETKSFGARTVIVTENIVDRSKEAGKWAAVTTWDGSKWVTKRVWFVTKKSGKVTKEAVVGDGSQDQ